MNLSHWTKKFLLRFGEFHLIQNFPKDYPRYRKIMANTIYFFTSIIIHDRKNQLTNMNIWSVRKNMKKGDILLVGNLRNLLCKVMKCPVTHSAVFAGDHMMIISKADGVRYIALHEIFTNYDTIVVLRHKKRTWRKMKKILR